MAPNHTEFDLEREWKQEDGWVQVAAPNPASGSLDSKTLKDHAEFLGSELEAARSELTALNNRIATSLVTGALVISLFANLLPQDLDRVAVLFVLGGLVLFLPIAWKAIQSPQDIEEAWIASGDPIPTALQKWKEDPWLSVRDSPLGIESYEQWHRMEAHRVARLEHAFEETFAEAQLPEGDYLVSQINLLKRKVSNISQRSERARRVLSRVHGWLSLLVVYLIVMVVFVRLF